MEPRAWIRRPGWILLVALAMRLAAVGVLLNHRQLSWGVNEPAGIARAIVEGRGFASAFHDSNWSTAWIAPVYPALLACVFRIFGVGTSASVVAAVLLNVVFASLTAVVLAKLGREQLGETAGIVAAWAWALAPPLLFMPWLPWETCLSGLVLAVGFMATLRLGMASRLREWAWCGAIWSFAALLNPSILAPLPVLAVGAALQGRRWKGLAMMMGVSVLGVLPWTARNFVVFGRVVPIRSNFWPEVYFGNEGFSLHPTGNSMLYQKEGELQFAADLKDRTLGFVRSNPREFVRLTQARIVAFWALPSQQRPYPVALLLMAVGGIVQARRRGRRWAAFASILVLYPLVYYLTYSFSRYRYPIEPIMYSLAAYFLCELLASGRWLGSAFARGPRG
jgi:hypothetical protein